MNKLLCIIVVLFSALLSVKCDGEITNITLSITKEELYFSAYYHHAKNAYLDKKSQVLRSHAEAAERRCPGYKEKVEKADQEFDNCVKHTFEQYNHTTICDMAEMFLHNCTIQLVNEIEECLPEQSKQLAVFIFKIYYSVTVYLCEVTGEILLELANPCLWKDLDAHHRTKLHHCEEQVKAMGRKYQHSSSITTKNICGDLNSFRNCVETRVDTTCVNQKTRRAFLGLYDAIKAPCNGMTHHV